MTITATHRDVLTRANVTPPDDLIADIEVPIISDAPQRQGDVLVWPRPKLGNAERDQMTVVPAEGVPVVVGEATGNTHLLHPEPGTECLWAPSRDSRDNLTLGVLHVPTGGVAWLIHTDEHGANGIGPGTYTLKGKREQADEERRVAD